jgi:hypothetical protein
MKNYHYLLAIARKSGEYYAGIVRDQRSKFERFLRSDQLTFAINKALYPCSKARLLNLTNLISANVRKFVLHYTTSTVPCPH